MPLAPAILLNLTPVGDPPVRVGRDSRVKNVVESEMKTRQQTDRDQK